jgi:type II secretory ATPase GspE/PulE/Tfp pilus assembly ATPase PilB-like protein
LEDPVEYEVPGIQQSQIQEDEWYTFEEGLRAVLRQDPDIVMVWEIRNKETAQIAINAALTWHLVLTTLHTNSAIETVDRLYNLGLPPYMIAQAINCIIGQRLVRKLVPWLSERALTEIESKELHDQQLVLWQKWISVDQKSAYPRWDGSHACYSGRMVVAEVFENTDEMKKLISWSNTTLDIQKKWSSEGNISFSEDGYLKVLQGVTTLDEVHRVL